MIALIKESIKRKFIITTFALIIFLITLSFPKEENPNQYTTISYQKGDTSPIYLLDNTSYVVRTDMYIEGYDSIEKAKYILSMLTIDDKNANYIPSFFNPIIPKGTKIISIDIQDTTIKVNFSKELLSIPEELEEKLIQCIVYSLTEIDSIDGVIIYVEGNILENYPNSQKKLPLRLTREIGVNISYQMNSLKNVAKTTIYYIAKEKDCSYYVPVTILENNEKEKIEIIIEHLKNSPNDKTNLMSYLNATTELSNYEILESQVLLSFTNLLYEGISADEIIEEVKYSIALSIKDTLNIDNVIFLNE